MFVTFVDDDDDDGAKDARGTTVLLLPPPIVCREPTETVGITGTEGLKTTVFGTIVDTRDWTATAVGVEVFTASFAKPCRAVDDDDDDPD